MAITVNSGKKINYFRETLESLQVCHKKVNSAIEQMRVSAEAIRAAAIDRAYNCAVDMGVYINEGIVAAGGASVDILEEMSKLHTVGEALVSEAKKVKEEAETVHSLKVEFSKVSAETIAGRGLDENWTDATIKNFTEAASAFIAARREMITTISEITGKNKEEDFEEVYMSIGRNLENISNNTVDAYNELNNQLELAGHGISTAISDSVDAAKTVGNVQDMQFNADLTGQTMDI